MTYSNYDKALKQLDSKPAKKEKYIKHNAPKERSCGKSLKRCRRCGRIGAHISKYGIHVCRQCFREIATSIGFKKYN
ncbi:MAG: 30S ribosomal protein S14 [Nanoarchaeota archaeon]|nr:30S ribosomal protein S14 [Nanoarchaeota archaeon]MBU1704437.1 30S ribosomal protein S14 [Nanoarchaeota archaeon]